MRPRRVWLRLARRLGLLVLIAALWAPALASAHSASSSYLMIAVDRSVLRVQWEIAVRDLDVALDLDTEETGVVTWGGLKRRAADIDGWALAHLKLAGDGALCRPGPVDHLIDRHGDGAYLVLRFVANCPAPPRRVGIRYDLLFDLDPQHRGLVNIASEGTVRAFVLAPDQRSLEVPIGADLGATFVGFFRTGLAHISGGADHLLFIAMLLVPAVFRREGRRWVPVTRLRTALVETLEILTAFTLAHALSLTASVLGWIAVPTPFADAAVLLTIVAAALDNFRPFLGPRRALVAFAFGLIHGLGFASALGPLALPALPLAVALAAFNFGVEAAQIALALAFVPLAFLLRRSPTYTRGVLPVASGLAALTALLWLVQRALPWPIPSL